MSEKIRDERAASGDQGTYVYLINDRDEITYVSDSWKTFAVDNEAGGLVDVVGKPLDEFIKHDEVRKLYKRLIGRVRGTGRPVIVPFRCDGPEVRRFMELSIERSDQGIRLAGRTIRTEPQDRVSLFDPLIKRAGGPVPCCSICQDCLVEDAWVSVETAVRKLKPFYRNEAPNIDYKVCPRCRERLAFS